MLSTHQKPGYLRYAKNLLPKNEGGLASRPGAIQLLTGDITWAQGWGDRLVAARDSNIVVRDPDDTLYTIMAATPNVAATAYQALVGSAEREDRFYFADGVNPLWYIYRSDDNYLRQEVVNTILDPSSEPYPIPIPTTIASWRNRIWIASGSNRAQHCQNDAPDAWDPLWTVECQNEHDDEIRTLTPFGPTLIAGMDHSLWTITGTSQYNWERDELRRLAGPDGLGAIVGDGIRLYWVSSLGVFSLESLVPLSEDIRELFGDRTYQCSAALDTKRNLLVFARNERALALNLTTGRYGEITDTAVRGVFNLDGEIGWYGADGAWLLADLDRPDMRKTGSPRPVVSVYDTWEDRPNIDGGGRALLSRARLVVKGSTRGNLTYTATTDGTTSFQSSATLADEDSPYTPADDMTGALGEPWWPTRPVQREFSPKLPGRIFRHRIEASCHLEVDQFAPDYRFKRRDE